MITATSAAQQPTPDTVKVLAPFERELGAGRKPNIPGIESYRLFEAEWGWVVVDDSALAKPIIATMRDAVNRFERIFNKPVGRGLFVVKAAMPAGAVEALMKAADAQWRWVLDSLPPAGKKRNYRFDFIRHELSHGWFGRAYDTKEHKIDAVWLQETTSQLMEAYRHEDEMWLLRRHPDFVEKYFVPLDTLFTMDNPVNAIVAGVQDEAYMVAIYAEFARLSDLFIERSLDPTIYRSIAEHFARGGNIADWLRINGPQYNLPTTVAELDQEWREWHLLHSPKLEQKPANP